MIRAEGISPAATLSAAPALQAGATVKGTGGAKLKEMATELEATFLSMLLKEMRQTLDPDEGGLFPGDSGDVYGGLFDLYLGKHLADTGGVGLAAALVRQAQEPGAATKTHTTDAPAPLNPYQRVAQPPWA